MKFAGAVVLILSLSASGLAITDFLRAGTNAARGAMNSGANLMNGGLDGFGRFSELPSFEPPASSPAPVPIEPLSGQGRQYQPANKPSAPRPDVAQSFGGSVPGMNSALESARSAVNTATSAGSNAMASLSSAISLGSIMSSIMSNPWVVYILNMVTSLMSYIR